jgi:hypothetical protein
MRAGKLQANTRLRPASTQALLRRDDLGVHVPLHHRQRGVAEFGIDVRDGIGRDDDREVPHVGIQRGVQNAFVR